VRLITIRYSELDWLLTQPTLFLLDGFGDGRHFYAIREDDPRIEDNCSPNEALYASSVPFSESMLRSMPVPKAYRGAVVDQKPKKRGQLRMATSRP
jgi:hypothetical protein